MRRLILLIMLLSTVSIFSQKIKFKKGMVYKDEQPFMTYTTSGIFGQNGFMVKELGPYGESIIFRNKKITYEDGSTVHYKRIMFPSLGNGAFLEVSSGLRGRRGFIRWLIKNEILDFSGRIIYENVRSFIHLHDERLSAHRNTFYRGL
ncbi:hypothetical protein [Tenacibaculum xiamenense]|uniref:hypothetical protein n=1 Tax=Tenacibaculum xiamenense TaxID=1261553 RepID=UPI0038935105